jgi:preprotein translocase subunit SecF
MKKAYLYFLVPLVGLALFGAVYWQFSSGYEKRQEERMAAERQKKDAKVQEENRNRMKAVEEAKIAQDKRKAEKAVKEARDTKDKEDRELAVQARRKAQNDTEKLESQSKRIAKEIEEAKKEIQVIEETKARSIADETFLKTYIKQVESNRAGLLTVVEKIEAADKAAEARAKEEAAAAAKKK